MLNLFFYQRILSGILLILCLSNAPFQCGTEPDHETALEDTPSQALWNLSERFHQQEQEQARMETLRQLIEQYPTSREAERARMILSESAQE